MAKEIRQKIVLDGEAQYRNALKEAQRNLRTLRSELKAETAELGANATQQQKNEVRAKSLKQQIKEQQEIVKTYRQALAEVREKYADNAEEIARWEQKLNDARTALANTENELQRMNQGLGGTKANADMATVATKSVGDALGKIGEVGSNVADTIEGIFSGLVDTLKDVLGGLWDMVSESAARANSWTDLASYYGSTATEMQKMSYAVRAAGGDFNNLINLVNQLSFGGKNDKISEWFGVSDTGYTDNLEYTMAVIDAMVKRRDEMMRGGTWDEAMTEVFGAKKAQNASWFVSNWGNVTANAQGFEERGQGADAEGLQNLNDIYVRVSEIESKWEAIKDKVSAAFAPRILDLTTNVSGALDGLNDFLNAENEEEREAALDKIRENVEGFFRKVADALRAGIEILAQVGQEMAGSDDPMTKMIGEILTKLTDALNWIVTHQDEVKNAFEVLFGTWMMSQLTAVAGKLGDVLLQIEAIKTFRMAGALPGAGGGATGTAGGTSGGIVSGGTSLLGPGFALGTATMMFTEAQKQVWFANEPAREQVAESTAAINEAAEASKEAVENVDQALAEEREAMIQVGKDAIQLRDAMGGAAPGLGLFVSEKTEDTGRLIRAVQKMQAEAETMEQLLSPETYAELMGANDLNRLAATSGGNGFTALWNLMNKVTAEMAEGGNVRKAETAEPAARAEYVPNPEDEYMRYLSDIKMRGVLHSWIDAYGEEGDNIAGWRPWTALQRYWGTYTNELGEREDNPLTQAETNELLDYIRVLFERVEGRDAARGLDPDTWYGENGGGRVNANDVNNLRGLPGQIAAAARTGTAEGLNNIKVYMDGAAVGRLVAPYVSEEIARDFPV